jgi:Domain of unknown function (DUF4352)
MMTVFDLVFLLAVWRCVLALVALCYFLLRRHWRRARRVSLTLGSFLLLYAVVLLSVSLLSPQHRLAMHQDRCFDDWYLSVEQVVQQPTLGASPTIVAARGEFYLVTVHVSSRAKAITQRAPDAQVYLLDASGQRSDPSPAGQQALDATGQGGQPLSSALAPGGSFARTVVFDLPRGSSHLALVVTHGLFPDLLVIGSEQSFLHKPTIIELQTDG